MSTYWKVFLIIMSSKDKKKMFTLFKMFKIIDRAQLLFIECLRAMATNDLCLGFKIIE